MRVLGVIAVGVAAVCFAVWPGVALGKYSGGTGEPNDPYLIGDVNDLHALAADANDYDKHFRLIADIDLDPNLPNRQVYTTAVIAPDTDASLLNFQGTAFGGSFDGDGKRIINLRIDTGGAGKDYLGLWGSIDGSAAEIKELGIENAVIKAGPHSLSIGGLCGSNSGTISKCYSSGQVTAGDYSMAIGGLCGVNYGGTIGSSYAISSVIGGIWASCLGGLCGISDEATIRNCYASGQVTGGPDSEYLGGLCGWDIGGTISNCYACSQVTGAPYPAHLGGLCGSTLDGAISNCYFYLFSGPDNGVGADLAAAQMAEQGCYAGFDFAGNPDDGTEEHWAITAGHCPKLTWQAGDGPVVPAYFPDTTLLGSGCAGDPYQINSTTDFLEFATNDELDRGYYILTCDIDLSGESFATAVIDRYFGGHLEGGGHSIENITIDTGGADTHFPCMIAVVCGSVSNLGIENVSIVGVSSYSVGCLCGRNEGAVSSCYARGGVSGVWNVGGLCGVNEGTVSDCRFRGSVCGGGNCGGLCAMNRGMISNCHAMGAVSGYDNLGGLCGYNSGTIRKCYATGNVAGEDDSDCLGGLSGYNTGTISGCYAAGSVSGDDYLGGLCGWSEGVINGCYATCSVSGDEYEGGFCGNNPGNSFTGCFWDSDINPSLEDTGAGNDANISGLPTTQMQTESTFTDAGWDFWWDDGDEAEWFIAVGEYPILVWQIGPGDIYADGRNNLRDWAVFADWWMRDDCGVLNYYCEWADLDFSGDVGVEDLALLAAYWLEAGIYD